MILDEKFTHSESIMRNVPIVEHSCSLNFHSSIFKLLKFLRKFSPAVSHGFSLVSPSLPLNHKHDYRKRSGRSVILYFDCGTRLLIDMFRQQCQIVTLQFDFIVLCNYWLLAGAFMQILCSPQSFNYEIHVHQNFQLKSPVHLILIRPTNPTSISFHTLPFHYIIVQLQFALNIHFALSIQEIPLKLRIVFRSRSCSCSCHTVFVTSN